MDPNYKGIIVIALIILALFGGGLYYIFSENQNHKVTLNLVQQYLATNDKNEQDALEAQIRQRIQKRSFALTSHASFDSFDVLISSAQICDKYAKHEQVFDPENQSRSYDDIWRDCMDHPEELNNQTNQNSSK